MIQTLIREAPFWFYLSCGLVGIGVWAFIIEVCRMFYNQRKTLHNNDLGKEDKRHDMIIPLDNNRSRAFRSDNVGSL